MTICDAEFKKDYRVNKVTANISIRRRLNSMGFSKGTKVIVTDFTLKKQTYKVEIEGSKVAIRKEEAERIVLSDSI